MKLTKANLTAAVPTKPSEYRHNLECLQISAAGVVSTDGHRLVCTPIEDVSELAADEKFLIKAEDAKLVAKSLAAIKAPRYGEPVEAILDVPESRTNNHVRIRVGTVTHDLEKVDEEFPAWKQVTPDTPLVLTIGFNADLLASVCKAVADSGTDPKKRVVKLEFYADKPTENGHGIPQPLRVSRDGAWGLLMPYNLD